MSVPRPRPGPVWPDDASPPRLPALRGRRLLAWANVAAVLAIGALDWATPAGVVVGIFLCVPIVLTSASDEPAHVWTVTGVAIAGFVVAAIFGRGPVAPAEVWVPNRIFAFLTLPASGAVALLLQRRRREAERTRDLNRILMSLLAHDLRAPLTLASQAFDYVEDAAARGEAMDVEVLGDVRARLRRSLRAIGVVLSVAGERTGGGPVPTAVADEVAAEVAAFAGEAEARGKTLTADVGALAGRRWRVDGLVLRQALAILLDNAVRYAVPGPVRVRADAAPSELRVRVADAGPGLSAGRAGAAPGAGGSGMGLDLSRALVARAGGRLEVERDGADGTVFLIRLPAAPVVGEEEEDDVRSI